MQVDHIKTFCREQKEAWPVPDDDRIFKDPGISGYSMEREGLKQVLAEIVQQNVDALIVTHLDRLTRNLEDLAVIRQTLEHHNCRLICTEEGIDTADPKDWAWVERLATFAEYQREMYVERSLASVEYKRKRGLLYSRPPYGFRRHPTEKGKVEAIPEQIAVIGLPVVTEQNLTLVAKTALLTAVSVSLRGS